MIQTFIKLWAALLFAVVVLVVLLFGGDWLERELGTGLFVVLVVVIFVILAAIATRMFRQGR